MKRRWRYAILLSAFAVLASAPARAQDVQTQMERVHDLAKQMFGMQKVYLPNTEIPTPCPDPCPCAQRCPCTTCSCINLTGTPNQKLVGRVWYWGWTLRNLPPSSPTRACARQYLLDHLALQQQHGHYTLAANGGEMFTVGHGQIWMAGMAAAYLFAVTNGPLYGTNNTADTVMLEAVKKWWADEKFAWDQISNGTGQVRMPGARFTSVPQEHHWELREKIHTLLKGQVPPDISSWPNFKEFTGGWIIDELRRRGHSPTNMLTPANYEVKGRSPETVCIYRRANGDYLHYSPQMRGVGNPLFWVRRENGVMSYAPLQSGTPRVPSAGAKPANFLNAIASPPPVAGVLPGQCPCPAPGLVQTYSCP